jgi:hypothetical protein
MLTQEVHIVNIEFKGLKDERYSQYRVWICRAQLQVQYWLMISFFVGYFTTLSVSGLYSVELWEERLIINWRVQ